MPIALLLHVTVLTVSSRPAATESTSYKSSLMRREIEIDQKHATKTEALEAFGEPHDAHHAKSSLLETADAIQVGSKSFPHALDTGKLADSQESLERTAHNQSLYEQLTKDALAFEHRVETEKKADDALEKLSRHSQASIHPAVHKGINLATMPDLKLLQAQAGNASTSLIADQDPNENNKLASTSLMRKESPKSHIQESAEHHIHGTLLRKEETDLPPSNQTSHAISNSPRMGLLRTEPRGASHKKTVIEVSSRAELDADTGTDSVTVYSTKVQKMLSKRTGQTHEDSGTFQLGLVHVILILCIAVAAAIGLPWLTGGVAKTPDQAMLIAYGGVDKGDILNDVYAEAQRRRAQAIAASLSRSAVGVVI